MKRHSFGRQFADHDVERGDQREGDTHGDAMGGGGARRSEQRGQGLRQHAGNRGLADPTKAQRGHGDSELTGRDVRVEVADHVLGRRGAGASFFRQLVETRFPHRHDGEFGGDEEAVGHDQQQDGGDGPKSGDIHRRSLAVGGGMSGRPPRSSLMQDCHRVRGGGAPCRKVRREQGHGGEHDRGAGEGERVGGLDAVQHGADRLAKRQ